MISFRNVIFEKITFELAIEVDVNNFMQINYANYF